jgi:hypothetical protein
LRRRAYQEAAGNWLRAMTYGIDLEEAGHVARLFYLLREYPVVTDKTTVHFVL